MKKYVSFITLLLFAFSYLVSGQTSATAADDKRMQWWKDAKFGMFIHWGVYAVTAGTYDGKQVPGIGE